MATKTDSIAVTSDQPKADLPVEPRPTTATGPAPGLAARATTRRAATGIVIGGLGLVLAVVAVAALAIHARTPSAAAAPSVASGATATDSRDRSDLVHGMTGHLVDGNGTPVLISGSGSGAGIRARFGRPDTW